MTGNGPGRPPVENWYDRRFMTRIEHRGMREDLCWTPKAGERLNINQMIRWTDDDGEQHGRPLRRYLWERVIGDETGQELTWEDLLLQADTCKHRCVNPHHALRYTRDEYRDVQRERMALAMGRADKSVGTGDASVTVRTGTHSAVSEEELDRWVPVRVGAFVVLLGTGRADYQQDLLADVPERVRDVLNKEMKARHPLADKAFGRLLDVPGGRAGASKRRQMVEWLWRRDPAIKEACDARPAVREYLELVWGIDLEEED